MDIDPPSPQECALPVICQPYRLDAAERDLLLTLRGIDRRMSITAFVLALAAVSLIVATAVGLVAGRELVAVLPDAEPSRVVPWLALTFMMSLSFVFARRMDAAAAAVPHHPEQTVTLSHDGVRVVNANCVSDWHWTAWVRYHDRAEALVLEEASGASLVIPARAFSDARDRAAATAIVAAHVPAV